MDNIHLSSKNNYQFYNINVLSIIGILGALISILGISLLVPVIIALVYGESTWSVFLLTAIGSIMAGTSLYYFFKPEQELKKKEGFLLVSLTWLVLSLIGALPFVFSGILESYTDAVFETMSGFTTTGSTIFGGTTAEGLVNPLISEVPKSLLFWRSLAHWLGGMGIIVLSLAILPLLGVGGMQLFQAESPGPTTDKLTPRVQETAKLLWGVYTLITFIEFILLWIHPSMDWFDAINHAFATLATGGFSTLDSSIAGFDSIYIDVVITIFMFLSGINFALYYYGLRGEPEKLFKSPETRTFAFVAFMAIAFTTFSLWLQADYGFGKSLRYGSFQAISILTSTGFATADYDVWPMLAQYTIFLMFFLAGCAGSTSGGIKMIHWITVFKSIFIQLKQTIHPNAVLPFQIGNQFLDRKIVQDVLSFFTAYLFICIFGAWFLSLCGLDIVSSLSATLSAMGNIGPGFAALGPTDNFAQIPIIGKWILIILMMVGRLEIFTVLVIFSPAFWKS